MKENEIPSYAQLLDYYKRTKTDDTVLTKYCYISTDTQMEEIDYLKRCLKMAEIRKFSIALAVKNITYGSAFPFAEQIYDYIMEGKVPENVKPEKKIAPSKD